MGEWSLLDCRLQGIDSLQNWAWKLDRLHVTLPLSKKISRDLLIPVRLCMLNRLPVNVRAMRTMHSPPRANPFCRLCAARLREVIERGDGL